MKPPRLLLAICNKPSITPVPAVIRTRKISIEFDKTNQKDLDMTPPESELSGGFASCLVSISAC